MTSTTATEGTGAGYSFGFVTTNVASESCLAPPAEQQVELPSIATGATMLENHMKYDFHDQTGYETSPALVHQQSIDPRRLTADSWCSNYIDISQVTVPSVSDRSFR